MGLEWAWDILGPERVPAGPAAYCVWRPGMGHEAPIDDDGQRVITAIMPSSRLGRALADVDRRRRACMHPSIQG